MNPRFVCIALLALTGPFFAACSAGPEESGSTESASPDGAISMDLTGADGPAAGLPGAQPPVSPLGALLASGDPDVVICTVNGEDLTADEVGRGAAAAVGQRPGSLQPEQLAQIATTYGDQLLEGLISDKLIEQAASGEEYDTTEEEVDAELVVFKELRVPEDVDLEAEIVRAGSSMEELREQIASDLRKRKMIDKRFGIELPDEAEVQAFYDENPDQFALTESVAARHILIQFDPADDDEAKAAKQAQAEALRVELVEGADFAALAMEHSDCPSSAEGGSLGTFSRGQMVPPFEETAFAIEPNTISEVVETNFGYHVIEVTEHTPGGQQAFEEVRTRIATYLHDMQRREAMMTYAEELRAEAEVEYAAGIEAG